MADLIYLPVKNVQYGDLFDWSVPVERCKSRTVTLSPTKSPRKDGLIVLKDKTGNGTLAQENEQDIALFRFKDTVYAVRENCPHLGGPLHLGEIEELADSLCVKCPWHGWKIDLKDGKVKFPHGHDVTTVVFPVKVTENGQIYIGFDRLAEKYFHVEDSEF
ncbi:hypothetical protein ACF0H5_015187 [Mactra antiquata]